MGLQNGRLPASMLARVPWAPGEYVAAAALPSLVRLNAAFRARFGRDLTINEGYRPYATQVDYKARTKLPKSDPRYLKSAMTPGLSVHGWGEAIDFGRIYGFGSAEYAWLAAHAPAFGWWQPPQYRQGGKYPEYWHWERNASLEQPAPPVPAAPPVPVATAPATHLEVMSMDEILTRAFRHHTGFPPSPEQLDQWTVLTMRNGLPWAEAQIAGSPAARVAAIFRAELGRQPETQAIVDAHLRQFGNDFAAMQAAIHNTIEARAHRGA